MAAVLMPMMALATTWYVNGSGGSDSNTGKSQSSAKATIQAAIDTAIDGDTILVAPGTYAPITTANKAITIKSLSGAAVTFIDGNGIARCATLSANDVPTYWISDENSIAYRTVLKGFTLRNGYRPNDRGDGNGGGGVVGGTLEDCIVQNCSAYGCGGCGGSLIKRCVITGNVADDDGGGVGHSVIYDSVISGNRANNSYGGKSGSGVSRSKLVNCTVTGNVSVRDESSSWWGPGAAIDYSAEAYNCVIYGNKFSDGLATYNGYSADVDEGTGEGSVLHNCYMHDPNFVDAANGDYRLAAGSPCIDVGDNSYVTTTTDLSGNARIANGTVDIGCYEYGSSSGGGSLADAPPVPATCTVTFNANGGSGGTTRIVASGSVVGTLPTPTRTGYTFGGWWTSASGGTKVSASTTVTGNETYYAHWTANSYTVTFNANGGMVTPTTRTVVSGMAIGTLPKPIRTGYTFLGWYTAATGGAKVTEKTKVTSNTTYYAHYEVVSGPVQSDYFRVTVSVADDCEGLGSVNGTKSVRANSNVTIGAKANKGNAFAGWYDEYGECVSWSASYTFKASADVSYTARFVAAREDWLWVHGDDQVFGVGESFYGNDNLYDYFSVESGSAPMIKVTGLPSGLKYDATTRTISGQATKRGVYYVTCSVQNGNGYKMSHISIWNVGNAGNGDYDNIGLDERFVEDVQGLCVGLEIVNMCCHNLKSITGLPPGLTFISSNCQNGMCAECSGYIRGVPTKVGVFKVTFSDYNNAKAVKTVVVRDDVPGFLDVVGDRLRGTVSGSGLYAGGATVKLSAKPTKGYYFAGWYEDSDYAISFSRLADWRKANCSFTFASYLVDECLYARFVTKDEDLLSIEGAASWDVDHKYSYEYSVKSETLPTETVKGLPAGIKWDKKGRFFYVDDRMKLKPGTTIATITAKNLSGRADTKAVRIVVPNLESWVFEGLDYSDDAYNYISGAFFCGESMGFEYNKNYKVTVSGLPPGMKLVANDGWASVMGVPTKAGTYTVTLTAKNGKYTERATFTINVHPLPDYAEGTFNGVLEGYGGEIVGTFTFTAAANGKQSVKVTTAQGTVSLSSAEWNCYYVDRYDGVGYDNLILMAYFVKHTQSEDVKFSMTLGASCQEDGFSWNCSRQLAGTFTWFKATGDDHFYVDAQIGTAQRNPFAKPLISGSEEASRIAEELSMEYGTMKMAMIWDCDLMAYRLECADCVETSAVDGFVTLKVNKNGTAEISGKLDYSSSFTASSTLFFDTGCSSICGVGCWEYGYAVFAPVVKSSECGEAINGKPMYCNMLIPIYWFP